MSSPAFSQALHVLQQVFGYPAFRGLQAEIIANAIDGHDALVLMPTGGGKSLCYQIPAIVRQQQGRGLTVVVSPLIALMHDQVRALQQVGVAAQCLHSALDFAQAQSVLAQARSGQLTLLYAAPERVTSAPFQDFLAALYQRGQLALFAIDEAHCVSQWGHDFRPEYRQLALLHERFPQVPRLALTATADAVTREDIIERLQLQQAQCYVSSFDRPNICYHVVEKSDARRQLLRFIEDEHEGDAGIVYCQSRKKVEETAEWLVQNGIDALPYHAGLPADERQRHQDRFLREEGLVMTATIAFGMGIDKPDVRFVAHLDMPKNIEGYYQETGRAGRDGLPADAWMAYGLADVVNQRRMIDDPQSPASEAHRQVMRAKLDALLAMAETTECRRVHLLAYFGEHSEPCGNCDNCLFPPETWDATEAARKLLSCIWRVQQKSGIAFGAGHLIDILRGKPTPKVEQHGHAQLSTFGIGADLGERQWSTLIRQLVARDAIVADAASFNTLRLGPAAKAVLAGTQPIRLRVASEKPARGNGSLRRATPSTSSARDAQLVQLDAAARQRLQSLKAWRAEVAREHGMPAYVIFHDATLLAIATAQPGTLDDLRGISGVGEKKLQAYGEEVLRLCR
ncbi:ATP-dependent DNA helicase RecQ [Lampropedia cohaerens]|uniref:DNA helicase RecQ n=1 Tax=Lampropedia cohaerens TaxID=1610491 RepID=A0A0U1Q3N7_9BURK|nr:DNA helicase RecQ [Lampropedia cohaerens]KKW69354.1 ATP-dependent DNA helicase RecQ [Lampropedia cohaerens]